MLMKDHENNKSYQDLIQDTEWEKMFLEGGTKTMTSSVFEQEESWERQFYNLSSMSSLSETQAIGHVEDFQEVNIKTPPFTRTSEVIQQREDLKGTTVTRRQRRLGQLTEKPKVLPQPLPKISFALENLWSNISIEMESPPLTLLFTSARKDEGATFVAHNFALYLSIEHSLKTIYVDCDVDAKSHPFLKDKLTSLPGLSDFFLSYKSLDELIVSTEYINFYLLPYGVNRRQVKLSKLLFDRARLKELLEVLKENFDIIILDTSPILQHAEVAILAKEVDEVILVCRYRVSQYEVSRLAVEKLIECGITKIKAVLNDRYFPIPDVIYKKLK